MTGRRKFEPADEVALRRLASEGSTVFEIAKALGRAPTSVAAAAKRLGVAVSPRRDRWSEEHVRILRYYAGERSPKNIARMVGRSVEAVYRKAYELDLHFGQGLVTLSEVAELAHVSISTVRTHLSRLGIDKRRRTRHGLQRPRGLEQEDVEAVARSLLEDPRCGLKHGVRPIKQLLRGESPLEGMAERMRSGRSRAKKTY